MKDIRSFVSLHCTSGGRVECEPGPLDLSSSEFQPRKSFRRTLVKTRRVLELEKETRVSLNCFFLQSRMDCRQARRGPVEQGLRVVRGRGMGRERGEGTNVLRTSSDATGKKMPEFPWDYREDRERVAAAQETHQCD